MLTWFSTREHWKVIFTVKCPSQYIFTSKFFHENLFKYWFKLANRSSELVHLVELYFVHSIPWFTKLILFSSCIRDNYYSKWPIYYSALQKVEQDVHSVSLCAYLTLYCWSFYFTMRAFNTLTPNQSILVSLNWCQSPASARTPPQLLYGTRIEHFWDWKK